MLSSLQQQYNNAYLGNINFVNYAYWPFLKYFYKNIKEIVTVENLQIVWMSGNATFYGLDLQIQM